MGIMTQPQSDLVCLPGSDLLLTPWHPIRRNGTWIFPCDIAPIASYQSEAVYSFLLDQHHVLFINGEECVGLAHGFTDNNVIKHPFFGTNAIVEALQQFPCFVQGLVVFEQGCM